MPYILIILCWAISLSSLADAPPKDHYHVAQGCLDCHSEGVDIALILKQNDNSCLQCHTQQQIADKLNTTSTPDKKQAPQGPHHQAQLGMSLPMLYPVTRVGFEPNKMVHVPAGKFIRGTNNRLPDEGPQHEVTLKAFDIDMFEVTNGQYKAYMDASGAKSPKHFRNRTYPEGKVDHPVVYVTWNDANDYCQWAGKRLPTDQEWEKAARGTDGREYPWGEEFDIKKANMPLRWAEIGEFGDTTPVGAFKDGVSPYGLFDMTGNVWEWTASWYQGYPGNTTTSESYGERYKTLKGGSWFDCSFYKCGISAPVYNRAFFAKRTRNDSFGFRCAKDAAP